MAAPPRTPHYGWMYGLMSFADYFARVVITHITARKFYRCGEQGYKPSYYQTRNTLLQDETCTKKQNVLNDFIKLYVHFDTTGWTTQKQNNVTFYGFLIAIGILK